MSFALEERRFPAPDGPIACARVPWDSATFGVAFHQLSFPPGPAGPTSDALAVERHLPALLSELDRERPALVATKIPVAAVALAEVLARAGFYPVETMLELHLPLARFRPPVERVPEGLALRPAAPADLPAVAAMARDAFRTDRFHLDPHLSSERADERYVAWVERGLAAGEPVFVYEDRPRARLLGFFHVREVQPGVVDLSLAAVEPGAQRVGVGLLLYQAVVAECLARGMRAALTHVTVANLDVLNLFARLGFALRDPRLCLHRFAG